MAEAIVGTPSIVGFGLNGYDHRADVPLSDMLVMQQVQNGNLSLSNQLCEVGNATHTAVIQQGAETRLHVQEGQNSLRAEIHQLQITAAQQSTTALLQAAENAATIRREIAECCCETQKLITLSACNTDQLIRQIDSDNAKLALANTTAELLAIKYRCCDTPVAR